MSCALSLAVALIAATVPELAHDTGARAPLPAGGVAWDMLGATEALPWTDAAGINRLAPRFSREVEQLDGKQVTLSGYAMPGGTARTTFTLYASEVDCEFHAMPGPNLRVEVVAAAPVTPGVGALIVRGRLELVRARQGGVFFRLHDAQLLPTPA